MHYQADKEAMHTPTQARALPLCSVCSSTSPNINALLENKSIQRNITAFNNAMASIDWMSYKQQNQQQEPIMTEKTTVEPQPDNLSTCSTTDTTAREPKPNEQPCFLCATKRAIPLLTSLLVEVKAVKKEQAANMSKAERKALKSEVKAHVKGMKCEVKKVKREMKNERRW